MSRDVSGSVDFDEFVFPAYLLTMASAIAASTIAIYSGTGERELNWGILGVSSFLLMTGLIAVGINRSNNFQMMAVMILVISLVIGQFVFAFGDHIMKINDAPPAKIGESPVDENGAEILTKSNAIRNMVMHIAAVGLGSASTGFIMIATGKAIADSLY